MSRKILEESYEIFLSLFSLERDSAPTPTRLEHITQSNISREQLDVLRCTRSPVPMRRRGSARLGSLLRA